MNSFAAGLLRQVLEAVGDKALSIAVPILVDRFGADALKGEVDRYNVARAAADAAEVAKFGPK